MRWLPYGTPGDTLPVCSEAQPARKIGIAHRLSAEAPSAVHAATNTVPPTPAFRSWCGPSAASKLLSLITDMSCWLTRVGTSRENVGKVHFPEWLHACTGRCCTSPACCVCQGFATHTSFHSPALQAYCAQVFAAQALCAACPAAKEMASTSAIINQCCKHTTVADQPHLLLL
jgi:hypothetical protein